MAQATCGMGSIRRNIKNVWQNTSLLIPVQEFIWVDVMQTSHKVDQNKRCTQGGQTDKYEGGNWQVKCSIMEIKTYKSVKTAR